MKLLASILFLLPVLVLANKPMVMHEWGTFTVLQDEFGKPVAGVNINEETLPPFVHRLGRDLTPDSHELAPLLGLGGYSRVPRASKGITRYYHAALMRMETPIIYLYPPDDQPGRPMNVQVRFNGGWITEWYPNAAVAAPGFEQRNHKLMMNLKPTTTGVITWPDVQTVAGKQVPQTDFPVWLAPRRTAAPMIGAPEGESEKYLFYRGVANLEAPLRVEREGSKLVIKPNPKSTCPIEDYSNLIMWLVDVDPEGRLQFRRVSATLDDGRPGEVLATTPGSFADSGGEGHALLRQEMLSALMDTGLFRDEAEAMLNTWEVSYFKTGGLRLFFTLPQEWTDRVLPLQVSGYEKTEQVRAMIGRIELISDRQRELVKQIEKGPVSSLNWSNPKYGELMKHRQELIEGTRTIEDFGLEPPRDYRAYMELGRFRDALVLHRIRTGPVETIDHVRMSENTISVMHPETFNGKITSFTISLPGKDRILNLGEMDIFSAGGKITGQARLAMSSNFEEQFPVSNLVDGNPNSLAHTDTEENPWIKATFDEPTAIHVLRILNRGGGFEHRFDGAEVRFFEGDEEVATVKVRTTGPANLRQFARNYRLPL